MSEYKFSTSVTSFIENNRQPREKVVHFLRRIVKDRKLAPPFLRVLLKNPRHHKSNFLALRQTFPSLSSFYEWYFGDEGYLIAYQNYVSDCWAKASKVEDVLKLLPNFTPWGLSSRFGGIGIGKVPADFEKEETFLDLIREILESPVIAKYREIKTLECCQWEEFLNRYPHGKKINVYDFGQKRDFICSVLEKECGQPFELERNGHHYLCKFLCNPFSCKIVLRIVVDGTRSYILKTLPFAFYEADSDRLRKEHENHAIRPDSPFSNAMLEFYLRLNKCPHAPHIHYYNYDHDVALYSEEKGEMFSFEDKPFSTRTFFVFNQKYLKDAGKLGVYVNDINYGNFLISAEDGDLKIIDIGHASYADPLNPGIPGICLSFGNLCGRDNLNHFGTLFGEE